MEPTTPRWQSRIETFEPAYRRLHEAADLSKRRERAELERDGTIRRFGFTWELAWKLLNDLLRADGIQIDTVTPRSVLKSAFSAGLISDGEAWMRALDARNRMSHT